MHVLTLFLNTAHGMQLSFPSVHFNSSTVLSCDRDTQKTYCTKGNINNNIINTRELSRQLLFHCKRSSKYYVQQQALSHYHKQIHKKVNTSSNLDLQYSIILYLSLQKFTSIVAKYIIMLSCYTLYIVHVHVQFT